MNILRNTSLVLACLAPCIAHAADRVDPLAQCLTDNTTGKDRKDLAKWIFVSMATHPEILQIGAIKPEKADGAQRAMAALVTRLMAENCSKEVRAAIAAGGAKGVESAFEHLGKIAMQELMTNPQVNESIGAFEKYLDQAKLEKAFKPE